jgi:hypothetical protein
MAKRRTTSQLTLAADVFIAFPSGSLRYDCAPCGRCCKGLGYADDLVHLGASKKLGRMAPFLDSAGGATPLASFYTYADGCRFLGDDNLCDLHRQGGPGAKPRICRLFPFSRLVDVDGMWALLPHMRCPWTASLTGADALSEHAAIVADLAPLVAGALAPSPHPVLTHVDASKRRAGETAVRDDLALDEAPRQAMARALALHRRHFGPALAAPERDLWLDLLRCAGAPPPLSPTNARLFVAALPSLRLLLASHVPLAAVPAAVAAFELWLRALRELAHRPLTGEDLFHLLEAALPLVTVMTYAELPLPDLPDTLLAPDAPLSGLWTALEPSAGRPFGDALLAFLRGDKLGPVSVLTLLGRHFPHALFAGTLAERLLPRRRASTKAPV